MIILKDRKPDIHTLTARDEGEGVKDIAPCYGSCCTTCEGEGAQVSWPCARSTVRAQLLADEMQNVIRNGRWGSSSLSGCDMSRNQQGSVFKEALGTAGYSRWDS
jgi:hypothetical protein